MATFFRNKIANEIGTTPTNVVVTPSNARLTVLGISLANLTNSIVVADVKVKSGSDEGFYVKDLIIPANTSARLVNGGEKLILTPDDVLIVKSNLDSSIDAVVSYVEIV
jgi:hypothetical protein